MVQVCEVCGEGKAGSARYGIGWHPADCHDVYGAPLCGACSMHSGYDGAEDTTEAKQRWLAARIRARRAEQPRGPVDGVPPEWREHIGKRVRYASGMSVYGEGILIGAYTRARTTEPCASLRRDGGFDGPAEWRLLTLIDSPPQAEASGDVGCRNGNHVYTQRVGKCDCEIAEKTTGGSGKTATREGAEVICRHTSSPQPPVDSLHFGPDTYPANPSYAIERERETKAGPPAWSPLHEFTAAAELHLLPRLPRGFRVVTDVLHDGGVLLAVLDPSGREILSRSAPSFPRHIDWAAIESSVAGALMAERARAGR